MADADGPVSEARTVWLGVVSLCLVQFIDVLGVTVMVTALPAMLSDLHASPDAASLVSTGYAMFFGGLAPVTQRDSGPLPLIARLGLQASDHPAPRHDDGYLCTLWCA